MGGNHQVQLEVGRNLYYEALPYIVEKLSREKNIFLIGKDVADQESLRSKIFKEIKNEVNVSFPEHLFEEQIFNRSHNLLSLENLLAESVDAIVLCVESVGSFTELGAFSNHEKLNDKLIVYLDHKYKRHNSFVNLGPVKYLKNKTNSKVIHINYSEKFETTKKNKLKKNIADLKKKSSATLSYDLSNLFFCDKYLLALIYTLGSIDRKTIIEIIKFIKKENTSEEKEKQIATIDASIYTLLRTKKIKVQNGEYSLDKKGREQLYTEFDSSFIRNYLDTISFQMLELKLSKDKYTGYLDSVFG